MNYSQLFEYNYWANNRYRQIIERLTLDLLDKPTPIGNLLERIIHIFASYEMWYQRMNGESPQEIISPNSFSNMNDLIAKWKQLDELLIDFTKTISPEDSHKTVSYTSLDGKTYTRKIQDILTHLIQHPSYHRGQISVVFRYLDLPKLPSTDIVVYLSPIQ